jgi:hypothetical protein
MPLTVASQLQRERGVNRNTFVRFLNWMAIAIQPMGGA